MKADHTGIAAWHGAALQAYTKSRLAGIKKERSLIKQLHQYIRSANDGKVCCLYGLWKTGKTVMLLQEIVRLAAYDKCLLLQCERGSSMRQLLSVIEAYPHIQYIFIDEVTRLQNFTGTASVLSDRYAAAGKKVVLTGTDSLGFYIASKEELYDHIHFIHTTEIPFAEQHALLGTDRTAYMQYGGTLSPDTPFCDAQTADAYVETAIVQNIVHTLEAWNQGRNYGVLDGTARRGELPDYIRRVLTCKENPIPEAPDCAEAILFWLQAIDVLQRKQEQAGESTYCFTQPGMQRWLAAAGNSDGGDSDHA